MGLFDVIHRTGWIPDTLVQRAVSTPVRGEGGFQGPWGTYWPHAKHAKSYTTRSPPSNSCASAGGGRTHVSPSSPHHPGGGGGCGGTYSTTGNTRDKIIIQHGISVRRANA